MPSLKDDFNELLDRIRHGRELGHASFEPIYYLVFSPRQILDVKRQTPAWIAKMRNDGWNVTVFSIAKHIIEVMHTLAHIISITVIPLSYNTLGA